MLDGSYIQPVSIINKRITIKGKETRIRRRTQRAVAVDFALQLEQDRFGFLAGPCMVGVSSVGFLGFVHRLFRFLLGPYRITMSYWLPHCASLFIALFSSFIIYSRMYKLQQLYLQKLVPVVVLYQSLLLSIFITVYDYDAILFPLIWPRLSSPAVTDFATRQIEFRENEREDIITPTSDSSLFWL